MTTRRFTPRIVVLKGISLYVGPCKTCPSSVEPWIKQFCSLVENRWYVEIDRDWATDWFNNYGMRNIFPNYDIALDIISDSHSDDWMYLSDENLNSILSQAKQLYGLLHARWICQDSGLVQMKKKYKSGIFGECPRFNCRGQHLLPMGTTLKPRHHTVKLFCPQCCDIYSPPPTMKLDGAHFGPAFPHIFFSEYANLDTRRFFRSFKLFAFGFPIKKSRKRFRPHDTNYHENDIMKVNY